VDEKLSQALERSNFMTTFANQKRFLWEKYQDDLVYYRNGHEIKITESLITFCSTLIERNRQDIVLIDANNHPFFVENLQEFLDNILDQYTSASNKYYTEYNTLKKTRSVEGLVNL
jgi:hypothetical protein